jgi:hypothetical protein
MRGSGDFAMSPRSSRGKSQDGMLQELAAFSGRHGKSGDCHRHQRSLFWHGCRVSRRLRRAGLYILPAPPLKKNESARPEKRHRTKKGSRSKGRTIHTIGRAQAIKGFVADRPLAIEPIANPALAMKNISDTTLHRIIAVMIPAPESGPFGPAASIAIPKGTSRETKTT